MLSLSRKADYALLALAEMARHKKCAISIRMLADRLGLPPRMMTNILNRLTHRGLVNSCRGSQGGYSLARPPEKITVMALLNAIEGPTQLTLCCADQALPLDQCCRIKDNCTIRVPVQRLHKAMCELLEQVTIYDIAFDKVKLDVSAAIRAL